MPSISVPLDVRTNMKWRRWVTVHAARSAKLQMALRKRCEWDLHFFVNTFVWQSNPKAKRAEESVSPFVEWPFQAAAFDTMQRWISTPCDGVIEKSRDMGATWMNLILALWDSLFHKGRRIIFVSKSFDAIVDRAQPGSHYWKLDFMLSFLPPWLKGEVVTRKRGYNFKRTGSTIGAEASTGRAAVGDRASWIFVDEFSQITDDYEVLGRTADVTDCRIFNGTHVGIGTAFFELTNRGEMEKLRMGWWEHPKKGAGQYQFNARTQAVEVRDTSYEYPANFSFQMDGKLRSPWYDQECVRRKDARQIAMDLDMDAQGSASQYFDGPRIMELVRTTARPPTWRGDVRYDDGGHLTGLVENPSGPFHLWLTKDHLDRPPRHRYSAGADVSYGTGSTPSVLSLMNDMGEKVALFKSSRIDHVQYAKLCVAICRWFKDERGEGAFFAWELTGPGLKFADEVADLGYMNVFRQGRIEMDRVIQHRSGWLNTQKNVRVLLDDYRDALYTRRCVNRSESGLRECLSFVFTTSGGIEHSGSTRTNDPSGARDNHGDETIADALAWMGMKDVIRGRMEDEERAEDMTYDPRTIAGRFALAQRAERRGWLS